MRTDRKGKLLKSNAVELDRGGYTALQGKAQKRVNQLREELGPEQLIELAREISEKKQKS